MERPNYKARAAIIGAPRATLGSPSAETLSQAGAAGTDADGTSGDAALTDSAQARGNGETSLAPHELAEQRLRLLFGALSIDPQPIQAILDWIDPDTETRFPHGAEDDYYTNQKPAYRAANRPFTSPRELLLVRGIDREIYDKLAPFVVCLPIATPINLNTAPKEILQSLSPNLDAGTVEILLRARATQPFTDLAAFIQHPLIQFRRIPTTDLSVSSEYFELRSHAHNRRFEHRLASVLARRGDTVTTVRRWRENFDE
jgi:general secretion pathway protein K